MTDADRNLVEKRAEACAEALAALAVIAKRDELVAAGIAMVAIREIHKRLAGENILTRAQAVSAEREACAQVADDENGGGDSYWSRAARAIAARIRARGKK